MPKHYWLVKQEPEAYSWADFVKDGRARHGQTIRVVDHLRKIDVMAEITDPVFHDKEGAKLRA